MTDRFKTSNARSRLSRRRLLPQIGMLLSLVSCVAVGAHAAAAPPSSAKPSGPVSPDKQIDALFKEWDTQNTPGASVAVIQHGKLIFAKGYGIANLEYNIPIKPDTIFHVASVSKQFTAMAVVLLELDGKLALDDDVHQYLPELPDYGNKITIRNLLQHTSGIRDQWQTLALAGWNLQDVITQDQALRLIFRQKDLNFPPGTRNLYSNSGFTLLAEIVTRVSGMPFPQFCAERIFTPLKMTHTHFHQDLTQLVPGRAYSYASKGGGFVAAPLNYAIVGATSLFTTASDLALWLDNFRDPKVGGAAGVARMQEEGVLSDGTKIHYGLGVALDSYRGLKAVSHGGGDAGYRSQVTWFPEQELGVSVVSNLGSINPDRLAKAVAEVYIGDKMTPQEAKQNPAEPKYVTMEVQELEKFAGVYPIKITQPGGAVNEGERIPAAAGTVDLQTYAGVYWSDELETQYTFFVRDGALYGRHAHHGEVVLAPTVKDAFSSGWWFTPHVKFTRDAAGNISGVTLGGGRVTAVAFTRKPGPATQEVARRKFEKH
jgi:CubicO group peptidase (beta-lactamase class C family)